MMNIAPTDQGDNTSRKIYTLPKLETYGSVSQLTQVKPGTKQDGGGIASPNTKA